LQASKAAAICIQVGPEPDFSSEPVDNAASHMGKISDERLVSMLYSIAIP
jgi:hypothetical protein